MRQAYAAAGRPPQQPPRLTSTRAVRRPSRRPKAGCDRHTTCGIERSFSSQRSLRLDVAEHALYTAAQYLAVTERVVLLSFPEPSRRLRLDAQHWRVQLLPVRLLWLTAGALYVACPHRRRPDSLE